MKNSERAEFRVGGDTLYLRENNIIHAEVTGPQTCEMAFEIKEVCKKLWSQIEGQCNFLIDINKCGKNDPCARNTWKELSGHPKTYKVATFGMNPVSKVIANFVIGTYQGKNLRFFYTEQEALDWIAVKE